MRKLLIILTLSLFTLSVITYAEGEVTPVPNPQPTAQPVVPKPPQDPAKIIHSPTNWSKIKDLFM
jgi:hypothetical protein